jgi:hypothetical protein
MPSYTGTALADTLAGSTAADILTGLGGNDTYLVDHLADIVVEAAGTKGGVDTIETSVLDGLGIYSLAPWGSVETSGTRVRWRRGWWAMTWATACAPMQRRPPPTP